jgi:hypothetical protein
MVAAGLIALAVAGMRGQTINPAGPAEAAAPANPSAQRANEAYSARLAGQAELYAPVNAYGARWQGLAASYLSRQRAEQADAARWAGLAEGPSRSTIAYAARWQGLAETYADK